MALKNENGEFITRFGEVDAAQISEWKKAHPQGIYKVESDNGCVAYFKKPTRTEVNYALAQVDPAHPLAHLVALAEATFLGGAEELLEDNAANLGVLNAIKGQINGVNARVQDL